MSLDEPRSEPLTSTRVRVPNRRAARARRRGAPTSIGPPPDLTRLLASERLATLRAQRLPSDAPTAALVRVCRLSRDLLGAPAAAVNLITDRHHVVAEEGLGLDRHERVLSLEESICARVVASGLPLVLGDATRHPWTAELAPVREGLVSGYLGVPLEVAGVGIVGVLCVLASDREWQPGDLAALSDLAATAVAEFDLHAARRQRDRVAAELSLCRREVEAVETQDWLTGAANRAFLLRRLYEVLAQGEACVLVADVDGFRRVNDVFGHAAGDAALGHVAGRLRRAAPDGALVARVGGDEFAILLPCEDDGCALRLGDAVLAAISGPMAVPGSSCQLSCTVSVGVASSGQVSGLSGNPAALLQAAEAATRQAQRAGGGCVQVYDAALHRDVERARTIEVGLREALHHGNVWVEYQPAYDLRTGELVGVEALARFRHPILGRIPAGEFITIAETRGLVGDLDEAVRELVAAQRAAWHADGVDVPSVWVNLSAHQLGVADLPERLAAAAEGPGASLGIEMTEHTWVGETSDARHQLERIAGAGVRIAIDDFGTGYSSLAYLHEVPADVLKVDRSFVRGVDGDGLDRAVIGSIVDLAASTGAAVVAEGVEAPGQLAALRELGCHAASGFLLAVPQPDGPELRACLAAQRWIAAAR